MRATEIRKYLSFSAGNKRPLTAVNCGSVSELCVLVRNVTTKLLVWLVQFTLLATGKALTFSHIDLSVLRVLVHVQGHRQAETYFRKVALSNTGLFISPSGIFELECATTKTDTAERSISIGRESLQVFLY